MMMIKITGTPVYTRALRAMVRSCRYHHHQFQLSFLASAHDHDHDRHHHHDHLDPLCIAKDKEQRQRVAVGVERVFRVQRWVVDVRLFKPDQFKE